MNQQETNTALSKKLCAEQDKYRDWLLAQAPEEILKHAYEFAVREDILLCMENNDLSGVQAKALLASPSPLEDVYHAFEKLETGYMDTLRQCIKERAVSMLAAQRELPVYPYPGHHAAEYGELEQYRASRKANIACKQAIEQAITEHYANNRLDRKAVKEVVEQFGFDRTFYVLASTVRHKDWDERISADNKAWAKTIPVFEDMDAWGADRNAEFVVDRSHPGIINLFVDMARHEHLLTLPLSKEDIQKEAARILSRLQAEREPNSPDGTHFMAQISPDFLARAKTRDQNRLMAMLPFSSHSLSTVAGRVGVFVLISKDENRDKPLRRRKPSVREKLSEKPPASPVKKAPSKERETR